jgi:hypothetical protein
MLAGNERAAATGGNAAYLVAPTRPAVGLPSYCIFHAGEKCDASTPMLGAGSNAPAVASPQSAVVLGLAEFV